MTQAKNRGQFRTLLFGPDYENLNIVQDRLALHDEKINELKELVDTLENQEDVQLLNDQIGVMEDVRASLAEEVNIELSRPSLFGWLRRMFIK